ncbi:MAG: HAMP domain-containing histidine kinase [Butyrivibrio sp.]|jgi:signal transduction histidine kinase|nr:HAMP domain-containing histidine kinase [Butyrivibrio sp.]
MVIISLLLNNTFLEKYYIRNKTEVITSAYNSINDAANSGDISSDNFDIELRKICEKYNIDVIVLDSDSQTVKSSSNDSTFLARRLWDNLLQINSDADNPDTQILTKTDRYTLQIGTDKRTSSAYMEEWGFLDNGNIFLIRSALDGIKDSVEISNHFMTYVGILIAIVGGILSLIISNRITKPILELTCISEKMKNLDFEAKYHGKGRNELDILGKNINELSETLEVTISELKTANNELKQDIEHKNKIDAMRKEFLSNVSHELKTPIALIQGYAEGLQEGINDDEESRNFYCEVIMDEAGKMNEMVKKLLTLNQLEFGNDVVSMERFDIVDLVQNYLKSADILAKQKDATVRMDAYEPIYVWADEFKVEEVLQNYYSNAINHLDGDRIIEIRLKQNEGKVRISVFNTGDPIPADSIEHIWEKFYKVDKARTREYGGSGVGLSIVKAIMDSMHQQYGVQNYDNGVEFWFELETK